MNVTVIIPAYNEEFSIAKVVDAIPKDCVDRVIVVDNRSTDATAEQARQAGAHVVHETRRGYGSACLRGIEEAKRLHDDKENILVFLDADFSDDPTVLPSLIAPIKNGDADLVIGSRTLGKQERGALHFHARFGNRLATGLIRLFFHERFTDLGPFRAIRKQALDHLDMRDTDYGWTVEMQAKAAIVGLRCQEVPVPYRRRIGRSKISGTLHGSMKAGSKILWTIFMLILKKRKITSLK